MRADHCRRAGATLIELLAALTLLSLIVVVVTGMCVAQLRLARAAGVRAAAADAARTATMVLAGEARRMTAGDVRAASADSIAIRAFRGTALTCGSAPGGVFVRYAGDRLPDPAKDSIIVASAGVQQVIPLLGSTPAHGACTAIAGEAVLEWRLATVPSDTAVLLVFESGAYHLSGRALRYRIGAAGRQPLTAELLSDAGSGFGAVTGRGFTFALDVAGRTIDRAVFFANGEDAR